MREESGFTWSGTVVAAGLTLNFLERLGLHWSNPTENNDPGGLGMWDSAPARWAFSAMSALFGGFGFFLLYVSFDEPKELLPALIFLGSAMTIVWSSQYKALTDRQ